MEPIDHPLPQANHPHFLKLNTVLLIVSSMGWYLSPSSFNLLVDTWPSGTIDATTSSTLQVHPPLVKQSISTSIGN